MLTVCLHNWKEINIQTWKIWILRVLGCDEGGNCVRSVAQNGPKWGPVNADYDLTWFVDLYYCTLLLQININNKKHADPWGDEGAIREAFVFKWLPKVSPNGFPKSQILILFGMSRLCCHKLKACLQSCVEILFPKGKSQILEVIRARWGWTWCRFGCPKCADMALWNRRF